MTPLRVVLVCAALVLVCFSCVVPPTDIPETAYDESEPLQYQCTPSFFHQDFSMMLQKRSVVVAMVNERNEPAKFVTAVANVSESYRALRC